MTDAATLVRGEAADAAAPRLAVRNLWVTFGNNRVLRDVALDVRPGELHALIGQNGSGKSTLAKVLTGLYHPDPGTVVEVDGVPLHLPVRPQEAHERGVAVVHQSLGLLPGESVLENMRIGRHRAKGLFRRIDWAHERAEAQAVFARLGRELPLDARVETLREEERATVAIARALQDATPGRGLIIFDESTRALGRPSLQHFFQILDEIVATGTAVLLITHRLEEVVDAADRVSILRDGRVVERGRPVAGLSEADLARLMLGEALAEVDRPHRSQATDAAPISVRGLRGRHVRELSLQVHPGEVLGLTGIAGSGYDDVPYHLAGVTPASAGTIALPTGDHDLSALTPGDAIGAGMALVPEGREHAGLAMGMTVAENTVFPRSSRARGILNPLPRAAEKTLTAEWIDRLQVRPPDAGAVVSTLSGGNQQKVLLAKWLATDPRLLLLHEPTQAVDVGARQTIVAAIRDAAASGRAVIVAGSDENELSLLCDRILVFDDGAVREELTEDLTPDRIVHAIYSGGTREPLRQTKKEEEHR